MYRALQGSFAKSCTKNRAKARESELSLAFARSFALKAGEKSPKLTDLYSKESCLHMALCKRYIILLKEGPFAKRFKKKVAKARESALAFIDGGKEEHNLFDSGAFKIHGALLGTALLLFHRALLAKCFISVKQFATELHELQTKSLKQVASYT